MLVNIKTKNWNTLEVIHRDFDFDDKLAPLAYLHQGYMQAFSDYLRFKYKKKIELNPVSGYRSKAYNQQLYREMGNPNAPAATTSFHIWRFVVKDNKTYAVVAGDYTSPHLSAEELYKVAKEFVNGEVYLHSTKKFVHISWTQELDEEFIV